METSNYLSQFQEEQARAEYLANQKFQTIGTGRDSSGKKLTIGKVNDFVQQFAAGLNAANMYNSGASYPQTNTLYSNQTQNSPAAISAGQNDTLKWVLFGAAAIGAVAWATKNE